MLNRVRVAVVGATGYGGAELVKLLLGHAHVEIVAVTSSRAAGERLDIHCPSALGTTQFSISIINQTLTVHTTTIGFPTERQALKLPTDCLN